MLSSTLKRTAATLGVLAGLLAATGPASAQILDGPVLQAAPHVGPRAPADAMRIWHEAARNGLTTAGSSEIYDHGITQGGVMETTGDHLFLKAPTGVGTQIGSEGLRPPAYTPPVGSNKGSLTAPLGST